MVHSVKHDFYVLNQVTKLVRGDEDHRRPAARQKHLRQRKSPLPAFRGLRSHPKRRHTMFRRTPKLYASGFRKNSRNSLSPKRPNSPVSKQFASALHKPRSTKTLKDSLKEKRGALKTSPAVVKKGTEAKLLMQGWNEVRADLGKKVPIVLSALVDDERSAHHTRSYSMPLSPNPKASRRK
eukprot:852413-Amorphochlora_amoeboformis.AAC.2